MTDGPGGGEFIHSINPKLHTEGVVRHEQERRKLVEEKTSQKPAEKINNWFEILERTHMGHRDKPEVLERIKRSYHNRYIIREDKIPQDYWNSLARRMIEEGRGGDLQQAGVKEEKYIGKNGQEKTNYFFPEKMLHQQAESLITDQKSSFDMWLDYLTSSDGDVYPMWAKYWAFTGMLKLSTFDKETHMFGRRTESTVAPFPDLDREALAFAIDMIVKKARKEGIPDEQNDPKFLEILKTNNFGRLYAYAIEEVTPVERQELIEAKGEWVKYSQGSDHMPLVKSLQGHGTGWCTAGESTAQTQLQGGDFYVYYTFDKKGIPTIPRVAIRMEGNKIAEVRGIAADQNLDPYMNEVVDEKLSHFEDGESYKQRVADMKQLTEISRKIENNDNPTREDLRFLYEIDHRIEGFGYTKDLRIAKLLEGRDTRSDIVFVLGCKETEVSLTEEEALRGGIKYHRGDLYFYSLITAEGLTLPEFVSGHLWFRGLTSAEGLTLPKSVGEDLNLGGLTSVEGLTLPESIGGSLWFGRLTTAKDLTLPKFVGKNLHLGCLTSAEGLTLPESIGGNLWLGSLTSIKGLTLPESIGGNLCFGDLTSTEEEILRRKYPNKQIY